MTLINQIEAASGPNRMPATDAVEAWRIIEQLTADEANTVTIVSGNADFNGQPNWLVICNGDWTNWQDQHFADDNRLMCLRKALAALKARGEQS